MSEIIKKTIDQIEKLYTQNLENFGFDSKSVGWKSEESQILRFDQLVKAIDNQNDPFTVNDWGCGYGAMYDYFQNKFPFISQYNGFDISEKMIDAARKKLSLGSVKYDLYLKDQPHIASDYTFISGIFNVKFASDELIWKNFVEASIHKAFEVSTKACAFNLLTTYVDWKQDGLYYADPNYYFDFCKKNISRNVTLIHDYNLYEWTIIIRK